MRTPLVWFGFVSACAASCVSVDGPKILVRDLARAAPEFSAPDGDQELGSAPLPGSARSFSERELQGLAERFSLTRETAGPVCFVRSAAPFERQVFQAALESALDIPGAVIEVVDFTRTALPAGRLEFKISGLNRPSVSAPEAPVIWRGELIYGEARTIPVWAKLRIWVEKEIVVAAADLPAGKELGPGDTKLGRLAEFPFMSGNLTSLDEVEGKVLLRSLRAGSPIFSNLLQTPKEVSPGMPVQVEATSGEASVRFSGQAQTGGRKGDTILVQNPVSGRTFRAVVAGKGKVEVHAPAGS